MSTVTLPRAHTNNAMAQRGTLLYCASLVAGDKEQMRELIIVRVWSGSTVVRACVWVRGDTLGQRWSGSGKAGGGGYNKCSAAVDEAFRNAGIIHEREVDNIPRAMEAVANAMGYRKTLVVEHG